MKKPKKPKAALVNAFDVDLSTWSFEALDGLQNALGDLVKRVASEAIQAAVEDRMTAYFPVEWAFGDHQEDGMGNSVPDDHTTLYVSLPLGLNDIETPYWAISLREIVLQSMENGEKEAGLKLRKALVSLVDLIDEFHPPDAE